MNGTLDRLSGIPVVINDLMGQVNHRPARPHKNKRIAKKWRKRFGMTWDYEPYCEMFDFPVTVYSGLFGEPQRREQKIICNTLGMELLKKECAKNGHL